MRIPIYAIASISVDGQDPNEITTITLINDSIIEIYKEFTMAIDQTDLHIIIV